MKDMNRLIILIVMIGLLFVLYRYQQAINKYDNPKSIKDTPKKVNNKAKPLQPPQPKPVEQRDSLPEELNFNMEDDTIYKQDSMVGVESIGSNSLGSLFDNITQYDNDSLFN